MQEKIPTGCRAIDEFLTGGLPVETVALIFGEAETGKTSLAIQCATNCATKGYKVLFVDCDGTFSGQRLLQIASDPLDRTLEMIILVRPKDFTEQAMIVDHLTDYINRSFKLVIFDTVTSLYRLRIAEAVSKTFELNRELNRQIAVLAQTAKTEKILLLLTSQVHSVLDSIPTAIEPVATRVVKFWADTVMALKPTENPEIIDLTIEKNAMQLSPFTCSLRIEQTGLRDCSRH